MVVFVSCLALYTEVRQFAALAVYYLPGKRVEYCDERVRLYVCLLQAYRHNFATCTSSLHQVFRPCYLQLVQSSSGVVLDLWMMSCLHIVTVDR